MTRKICYLLLFWLLPLSFALAQDQRQVSGKVTDDQGVPLQGVTVAIKGRPDGVATGDDGGFRLSMQAGDVLVFRMVGYTLQEVTYQGEPSIAVELAPDQTGLDEVVVVGYGTATKRNITSSISTVSGKELEDKPVVSFEQALAGKVPGVNVAQSNGAPGGGLSVNIRGTGSITGGTQPLYVVDGVPLSTNSGDRWNQGNDNFNYTVNPLNSINPTDIESIQVLKDAAATAIYGSRGANGVVIITTKKGGYGEKATIAFNASAGISKLGKKIDLMDAYEHANYTKLARDLSWINKDPANHSADDPLDMRNIDDRYPAYMLPYIQGQPGLVNTDWQDEFYVVAPTQNYDLSVSGGTDKTRFFVSANYMDQKGIVPNSGVERFSGRVNLESNLTDKFKIGVTLNPSFMANNLARTEKNWGDEGLVIGVLMQHPQLPVYNSDGSYAMDKLFETMWSGESNVVQFQNPVALANLVDNRMNQFRTTFGLNAEYEFIPGLKFKSAVGGDLNYNVRNYYRPKSISYRTQPAPTTFFNYGSVFNSNAINMVWDNTLEYQRSFNNGHEITAVLGNSVQREVSRNTTAEGRNFATDNVRTINTSQERFSNESQREWGLISYFSRVSYNYQSKYLLSGTVRADGSSKFGANTKWGMFPSISGGWRVSEEEFFDTPFIDDLKIRGSYGVAGNNDIPYYGAIALLAANGNYVFDDQMVAGLYPNTAPNRNLSWESTKTIDLGFDLTFGKYYTLTAAYYDAHTTDLLLQVPVPSASGYTSSLQNVGELQNRGVELLLSMNRELGKGRFTGSVNFSRNRNKVLALGPGQDQIISNGGLNGSHITQIGYPVGSFFGYNILGKFQTAEQLANLAKFGNQQIGDFIYEDINNDGVVNADDRQILGNNHPDFQMGVNLGYTIAGFDLSLAVYANQGQQVINTMHRYLAEAWGNNLAIYLTDEAPRPVWGVGSASHTRASSWQIEDASFIRVRDVTLGYTIPSHLLARIGVSNLRVYTSMLNPITWTNYSGYNPEISSNFESALTPGEEFGNYPISKITTFGVNLSF